MSSSPAVPTAPRTAFHIDLYADVVCPWCWVGERRLHRVLKSMPEVEATVAWRPFQLRPDMPPEGQDWQELINTKFGGAERAAGMFAHVAAAGAAEGITFAFDRIARASSTTDAHRLILHASATRPDTPTTALAEALFRAYFTEGHDVGDQSVLVAVAVSTGLDGGAVRDMLDGDAFRAAVTDSQRAAAELGVRGVPFAVLDGRLGISGAQPDDVFRQGIQQALTTAQTDGIANAARG